MDPIRASRAGTCARTGKRYAAGALIVKTTRGWALAQDKAGNIKIAPDWRLVRLPDGRETQVNVNLAPVCRACFTTDGHNPANPPKDFDLTPYQMTRHNDVFTCPRCQRAISIIPQAELDARKAAEERQREIECAADREANLHLEHVGYGFYQLSHRLGPDLWKKVAHLFNYWSADDMDQMDYFDITWGGYFVAGGPVPEGVLLNGAPPSSLSNVEEVELILAIKPENTVAAREGRAAEQRLVQKAREERIRALDADRARLFRKQEAQVEVESLPGQSGDETLQLSGEKRRYGAESLIIRPSEGVVWHITNYYDGYDLGCDRPNEYRRFDLTPERIAFIDAFRASQEGI